MIYCSFCCIYVWLDPGTYMIARFMSFYKLGVTAWSQVDPLHHRIDDALVGNTWCSCAKLHDTLKIFLQGHASLPLIVKIIRCDFVGLTARKLAHNSRRSCFQDIMVPGGMFAYHHYAKPFKARTSAFALHAVPPPDASMVASYLRRNSSGSDSPSNCSNIAELRWWGHCTSSSSSDNGDILWCLLR